MAHASDAPQSVVFVVPQMPSYRGNGLSMRAFATLKLLSSWCPNVHLLIVPLYAVPGMEPQPEPEMVSLVRSWQYVLNPDPSLVNPGFTYWRDELRGAVPVELQRCGQVWRDKTADALKSLNAELIVVFRFYLGMSILPGLNGSTPTWLDVDELESQSRARLMQLYALRGHEKLNVTRMEVPAWEGLEKQYLPRFSRFFVASKLERNSVLARHPEADVRIMPNIFPSSLPQEERQPDGTARFLFVGGLNFFPNGDAIMYFAERILPIIKQRAKVPVEITAIGQGVAEPKTMHGINFLGAVEDTSPYYASCDAAIIPLRAGGGTRIKMLEAFSHKRVVVSTTIGAEGLNVEDKQQLYIADDAESFAQRCLDVIENANERRAIAERAHEFFLEHHSADHLEGRIPELFVGWKRAHDPVSGAS